MRILTIIIIVIFSIPIYSKDFKMTEDIINSILNNPPTSKKMNKTSQTKKTKKPVKNDQNQLTASDASEVILKTGIQFYNSGLYSHSLAKFNELITKHPQSPYIDNSRIWLGKINIKLYEYNKALNIFKLIPDDSGEYPTALYFSGECETLKGNFISSIEFYQKIFSLFPEHELADNALLRSAKLYLNNKKGNQALESTIKLIKYYQSRETIDDAYYLLGKIFEKSSSLKDLETSRRIYTIFLKKAHAGEKNFFNSPLTTRVKKDLQYIKKNYFKLEN